MASIQEQLQNVRTMEDIVNLLSIIFTNLNNQSREYFDMFLNPVPMDLDLEMYNENGELVTVTHPNVAKMRISAYSGTGNPNGVQVATIGALYIDTNSRDIYYKATGSDSYGWQKIWTTSNLVSGMDFLAPNGDGSQVQNLNVDNVKSGTLPVQYGGTGRKSITGIIKGNGVNAFETAQVDVDYLAPSSFTGLIMTCPLEVVPDGWLICDGFVYNMVDYPRLGAKLGSKYGGDGITTFGVPNLIGQYVKYGTTVSVGTVEEGHIGAHTHTGTATAVGAHKHGLGPQSAGGTAGTGGRYGTVRIYGQFQSRNDDEPFTNTDGLSSRTGAINLVGRARYGGCSTGKSNGGYLGIRIDTNYASSWSGAMTEEGAHSHTLSISNAGTGSNEVDHIVMVPIIKY